MLTKKPELVATARDIEEVKQLCEAGVDAVIIGNQQYGLRVTGDFALPDIKLATQYIHEQNKKVFISANAIFHNQQLETLPMYLKELENIGVDAVICGDPAIFPIINEINTDLPIFWHPETLSTNYETLRFWQSKGIQRAVLSNELSLEAVLEINNNLSIPIEIQIHGMTCIFQSKRKLVSNYYRHLDQDISSLAEKQLHVKQHKESDSHYPIYEDVNGTHIMSNEDICMIDHLDKIVDGGVDSLRINGLFQSRDYVKQIVHFYRQAIDQYVEDPERYRIHVALWKNQIENIQPTDRKLDTGFYFKKQIY